MIFKIKSSDPRRVSMIFWITILFLLISSGKSYSSALLDRVVAVVNKEVITWSELYRAMEFEASSGMKSLSDDEKKKVFKESEAFFLEAMIDTRLQIQAARKLDIDANKDEISEAIEGIKKKYGMDDKEFQESLKREGFTMEEYKKRLSEQIILSKVVGQQVKNKIVISDEEIKEYMSKNKDVEYRVRQIFFRVSEKNPDPKFAEARAEEVLQRLKSGEDFPSLAQRYSDDPTGRIGGDLGFIKKEQLGKEFIDVLSNMPVGAVSSPFWTGKGLHIIKLEEKLDAGNVVEFTELTRTKLFEKRFNEEYRSWIRGLREKAYVEVRL